MQKHISPIRGKDLPNMSTFCNWFSEKIVISVYNSFLGISLSIRFIVFHCPDQTITAGARIGRWRSPV